MTYLPPPLSFLTGAVLAGGQGARLSGADKGLLRVAGRPLIEHVLERLVPQVARVVINANRHRTEYARYGHPVVADDLPEVSGPLAGMHAVLKHCQTDHVLFVPCDAALLPRDLAVRLKDALQGTAEISVVHDGTDIVPVCCLVPTTLKDDLEHYLAQGGRQTRTWLHRHPLHEVRFPKTSAAYWSMNTPEEQAELEHVLSLSR